VSKIIFQVYVIMAFFFLAIISVNKIATTAMEKVTINLFIAPSFIFSLPAEDELSSGGGCE